MHLNRLALFLACLVIMLIGSGSQAEEVLAATTPVAVAPVPEVAGSLIGLALLGFAASMRVSNRR